MRHKYCFIVAPREEVESLYDGRIVFLETILKTEAEDRAEVEVARGRSLDDSRKSTRSQSNLENRKVRKSVI